MQRLEVSGAVRPLYGSLGVKGLNKIITLFRPSCKALSIKQHTLLKQSVLYVIDITNYCIVFVATRTWL